MNLPFTLSVRDLSLNLGGQTLFQNLNLDLRANEFVTLMGENGVGKTCFLETICGMRDPSKGSVLFWGNRKEDYDRADFFSKVGWVSSSPEIYPLGLKVFELFNFLESIHPHWNAELGRALISGFQLSTQKKLSELSLGEHSKVRLVQALSFEPQLLLLDELTANLSPDSKQAVLAALMDIFSKKEMSVLYVCHSQEEAIRLSDRKAIFKSDGIIIEGIEVC